MKIKKAGLNLQSSSEVNLDNNFSIVGIGASAGGLEPITKLLENLPIQTGLSFVVIQHLASGQESMLPEILSRSTKMKVQQAKENMHVEQNQVYVIAPGTTLTLNNGSLKLLPKKPVFKPINEFLLSLASEQKTRAIGIVLSGTGNDGTEGLKAIKVEGGITFAQDPGTSQYPDMPKNAIAAGTPDFILSPEQIAKELVIIAKSPQLIHGEKKALKQEKGETDLKKIITLLKASFGVDFTHYRETTVNRRITRRMVINKTENMKAYVAYLRSQPSEQQALFDDMLIGVTSFFREPKTFEALKEKVFPELVQKKSPEGSIRIWVPGCSTGEEVYSLTIAIQEFLEEKAITDLRVQIFGTDANEKNIEKARQGIYPRSIENNVSENRLKRFFTSDNGHCRIIKSTRDLCIFAKQDITTDPPFSNIDLIMCRNVLIYFDSHLHERVLPIFHYGLKPNGFLVLGESESVGKFQYLFEAINPKGLIYKRKQAQPQVMIGKHVFVPYATKKTSEPIVKADLISVLGEKVDRLITTEYGPATLLVNSNLDILVFRGDVAPFLSPESGAASLNVTKIIRKELRSQVQTAVYRARKESKVFNETVRFKQKGVPRTVNVEIRPIKTAEYDEAFYLVLFTEVTSQNKDSIGEIDSTVSHSEIEILKDRQIRELREDLEATKESLQTLVEGQEATNEELRSSMEEVQSSNEELQSTNEELETAKEELQSSNEELQTLNEELKNRNLALGRLNDDLANLQTNIDLPVVIVDYNLKIRRFTTSTQGFLKILPSDVGRSITSLNLGVHVADLEKTITNVITKLRTVDSEVTCSEGRLCEMRVRPYLTEDKKVDGAVLSFTDITEREKANRALRKSEEEYSSLFVNMIDGFAYCKMIFDKADKPVDFVYLQINDAFERITGLKRDLVAGKKVTDAIPGIKAANPELFEIYGRVALTGQKEKFEVFFKPLNMWLNISVYCPAKGYFAAVFEDITERKKAEDLLLKSEVKFRTVSDFTYDWEYWISPDGNFIYVSPSCKRVTGYDADEFIKDPKLLASIVHPEDKLIVGSHFDLISSKELHAVDFRILTRDGETRWIAHSCQPVFDIDGKWIGRRGSNRDITERKKMERELSSSLEKSRKSGSEISALLKASRAVLKNKEFQGSARAIFDAAKELIGATAGYVALLSDNGRENEVLFLDAGGLPCTVDPTLPMPIRGLRAEAYNSGEVVVENNFDTSKWKKIMPDGHVQLKSVLFAPLMIEQRAVGVIGLANKPGGFVKRDAEMAMGFGEIASVALVNSKMLEMLEENEEELRKHSVHLEDLVDERTKQLKDSERMATIGQTAGMVGHDIRNPLQAITGDLYLVKADLASIPESEEKKSALEGLQEIEKNIDYINKVVADLQDFARPLRPNVEETDLKRLIDDLISKNGLPENIKVSVKVEAKDSKIIADSAYINRIMSNLVNNAVQAMPNGGALTIHVYEEVNDVIITVKDTGVGIPEGLKNKLFIPLFTTKAKGQGFGLPVIKRMTEALGGTVTFESREGKGTTFTVRLPPIAKR